MNFVDINLLNSKGRSLLSLCCENNFKEGVDRIINDVQFDFVATNFSSLLFTVFEGQNTIEIIRSLVDYDSKHSHFLNFDQLLPNGKSFFTQIKNLPQNYNNATNRNRKISNPIISFDAISNKNDSIDKYEVSVGNNRGSKKNGDNRLVHLILFLIEKGVDVNKPDLFGVYPLQYAIQSQSLPYVQTLLNSGKLDFSIKINTKHITNGTYLHIAANSSEEIVRQLVSRNIFDLNSKDDLGRTPYMIAQQNSKGFRLRDDISKLLKGNDRSLNINSRFSDF